MCRAVDPEQAVPAGNGRRARPPRADLAARCTAVACAAETGAARR